MVNSRLLGLVGAILLWAGSVYASSPQEESGLVLELVESVPSETDLDRPEVREASTVWRELLASAKKTLLLNQFYLSSEPGTDLEAVLDLLLSRVRNGLSTRVLVEKKMSTTYPETMKRLQTAKGVELRLTDLSKTAGGVNHAKYFVLDHTTSFVGSQNFDWRSLQHIHEVGVIVTSPAFASALGRVFEYDWAVAGGKPAPAKVQGEPLTLSNSARGIEYLYPLVSPPELNPGGLRDALPALVALLDGAKKSLKIQVMSYALVGHDGVYRDELDRALRRANQRKVSVKLLVADWSTGGTRIDELKSLEVLPNIEIKISSIPEHSSGFIPYARVDHAKYLLVDDEVALVGTSNWSVDYFTRSRDIEVVFKDKLNVGKLVAKFKQNWSSKYVKALQLEAAYTPRKNH